MDMLGTQSLMGLAAGCGPESVLTDRSARARLLLQLGPSTSECTRQPTHLEDSTLGTGATSTMCSL